VIVQPPGDSEAGVMTTVGQAGMPVPDVPMLVGTDPAHARFPLR